MSNCSTLLERINNLFIPYHSLGMGAISPTGEPYIVNSIGYNFDDGDIPDNISAELEASLYGCFHNLRFSPAVVKLEGDATLFKTYIPDIGKATIYWRRHPMIDSWTDENTGQRCMRITCRVLVSAQPRLDKL